MSIKENVIWQSLFFWDNIAYKFQLKFGDAIGENYSPPEKEYLKIELRKFAKNMVGWGGLQAEAVALARNFRRRTN